MPYKRVGKKVMHKKDGWSVKQTATSVENAKKTMNLLRGVEHGWKPTGKKSKHHSAANGSFLDKRRQRFGVE